MNININDVLSAFALLSGLSMSEATEFSDIAKLSLNKIALLLDPSAELTEDDKEKVVFAAATDCFYKYTLIRGCEDQIDVGDVSIRSNKGTQLKNASSLRNEALRDIDPLLHNNIDGFYFSAEKTDEGGVL